MSKDEAGSNRRQLNDGDDSGAVPDGVRFQVFVDGLGICAAPDCNKRSVHHRTKLAECAHIIPRRVGSHPREDYLTPLIERNQESNLLYLCEPHHKIVDDTQHAAIYTVDVLRRWKGDHEKWAKSVTKDSPYLPDEIKEALSSMGKSLAEKASEGKAALGQLIEVCRSLVDNNRVSESRILLAQISTLTIRTNDSNLIYDIEYLNARLLRAAQNIPESKKVLLDLIHSYGSKSEAMGEYVELCKAAPEPGDELETTERLLRALDPKNPHITVSDLLHNSQNQQIPWESLSPEITQSRRFYEQIFAHNCATLDADGNASERDQLVQRWSEQLPTSARPLLFQAIFTSLDAVRSNSSNSAMVSEAIDSIET
ncbi:MAG: hypothetical protein ACRCXD_08935, partial [Luteolibacter sp.]